MPQKVLMKGNEALAEAAIQAGCRHFFGYPITPQNEISAYMSVRMPEVSGTFLQVESEIAAINMVLGAASTGARAMTSSSSPGISLKTECISFIAACDLPCVIASVQRAGPGLGGIQPAQQDYFQATKAPGHGGFKMLVYAPSTVQEMMDYTFASYDAAEKYLMPAMILADGLVGQMMEPVELRKAYIKPADKSWAVGPAKGFDGRNIINSLYLKAAELEEKVLARERRYAKVISELPQAETYMTNDADVVIVAYGASSRIARSAINEARAEGIKVGLVRPITLWPFPDKIIKDKAKTAKSLLVVEMNSGQMIDDVRLAVECSLPVNFYGRTAGIVPTPGEVLEAIKKCAGGER